MDANKLIATGSNRSQIKSGHLLKMDPIERYGRYEGSRQPEKGFNQSLHWSRVKEETEECAIQQSRRSAVSLRVESSQVLPSVPVKEEFEEGSLQTEDKEESLIKVKKEENEDWLKSDDEDVVRVTVPWETLETSSSPPSFCSDTEDSEMEGDDGQECENHECEIKDCSRTSLNPGTKGDSDDKANPVDICNSEGVLTFYPCPHCTLGFTIERFFHGHLRRAHAEEYNSMLKSGKIIERKVSLQLTPATCPQCGKSFSSLKFDQHLVKMDRFERSGQPEQFFDHSSSCSTVKEEADECEIQQSRSAVSFMVQTTQVSQEPNERGPSLATFSDLHGVPDQERRRKDLTYLRVTMLPPPGLVKEESEGGSLKPVGKEEASQISVKEENEDWLKSDDEDVVRVTVPWKTLETSSSPPSSCSDTEDSEMEGDGGQDCEIHEDDVSGGLKIKEDCSRTSLNTDKNVDAVDISNVTTKLSKRTRKLTREKDLITALIVTNVLAFPETLRDIR
ncbi:hypothetical protein DPEC_G00266590 [Dallia pectoralis]|uniref:Uncharacterized protein n=1 Tax=Dallia pectoralis TaxID=75939 RepID=A0ACC2FN46_DALPE|nr:hypothetical protein DPEC_G00266590 [Dallia pectoralis]